MAILPMFVFPMVVFPIAVFARRRSIRVLVGTILLLLARGGIGSTYRYNYRCRRGRYKLVVASIIRIRIATNINSGYTTKE